MALRTPNTDEILIKSPITSNGRDPIMGPDGRQTYKETIAMASARKTLEKQNEKLPTHLKMIIEDIKPGKAQEVETTPPAGTDAVAPVEKHKIKKSSDDNK